MRVCQLLFWLKFAVSFSLALLGLAFLGYLVHQDYIDGMAFAALQAHFNADISPDTPIPAEGCARSGALNRVEPPDGSFLMGFSLNWTSNQTPIDVVKRFSPNPDVEMIRPSIYNGFYQFDPSLNPPINYPAMLWQAQQVKKAGGVLELTVEPHKIDTIPQSMLQTFANNMKTFNDMGVPILLRYGHEMNGNWVDYAFQPAAYKLGFQNMANVIHATTNMTAMLWSPNVGIDYPFTGNGGKKTPANTTQNFKDLDTNGDGKLTYKDDPYSPYWPGAEVGLSLYYYVDKPDYNTAPPLTYFHDFIVASSVDQSDGPGNVIGREQDNPGPAFAANHNFYQNFVVAYDKPFIIAESASPYFADVPLQGGATELSIKQGWWRQVLDTARSLPKLKAFVWFEEYKKDDGKEYQDWRILDKPDVQNAYVADLKANRDLISLADNLQFHCDGSITLV